GMLHSAAASPRRDPIGATVLPNRQWFHEQGVSRAPAASRRQLLLASCIPPAEICRRVPTPEKPSPPPLALLRWPTRPCRSPQGDRTPACADASKSLRWPPRR